MAIGLAVVSIGVLIYFIHHVASSVQPEIVADKLQRDVIRAIGHRFAPRGQLPLWDQRILDQQRELLSSAPQDGAVLRTAGRGFIQAFDSEGAVELASRRDIVIVFDKTIGDFLTRGTRTGWVLPPGRFSDGLQAEVDRLFILGPHRTIDQDVQFGLEELVDIAVRALSKGISLPFMAAICVNHLRSALSEIMEREPIPFAYVDGDGQLRVIGRDAGFASLLETAFGEVRRAGADSMPVLRTLLGALSDLGERAPTSEQRQALLHQAELIKTAGESALRRSEELDTLGELYRSATEAFRAPRPDTRTAASPSR